MLTLYRRHRKDCIKGYAQNQRVYRPGTARQRKADCDCPINAEGKLRTEFITNRSTKTASWNEAEEIAFTWEKQGTTEHTEQPTEVTIGYAVEAFLASQGPSGRAVEPSTYHGFQVLLQKRLLPYSVARRYDLLAVYNDLDVTTKFVESWINLIDLEPLADSTKKTELERLRAFFAYCLDRKWLEVNQAKRIKFTYKTEPKFGMSGEEEREVFKLINRPDLLAFCLVMRWAGLRISDATMLNDSQLIERASGNGWAIKVQKTQKNKETVYVPIPGSVVEALRSLPFQCTANGRRYWFWSGECEIDTAKDNWYKKVMRVLDRVQFLHEATPHTFRHTFAISHLNAGVDIKMVSRWLSHSSVTVTEKHYAHAIRKTLIASDEAFELSLSKQVGDLYEKEADARSAPHNET